MARLGHHPAVILPAYRQTHFCGQPIEPLGIDFIVPIGSKMVTGHLLRSTMPGGKVPVYLVEQDQYYDRDELYSVDGKDYIDNCERFVFFSRAVLEAIRLLDLQVDVLHANDWQTGLVPAYLKIEYRSVPRYQRIASLLTVHNISYQGQFWHWDMLLTGLDWKYFNWRQMEFHGNLNLLKAGMVFADAISTVSPRYAQEIQSSPLGCGLEGVLQCRRDVLPGILNGIDPHEWDPQPIRTWPYTTTRVRRPGQADLQVGAAKGIGATPRAVGAAGRHGGAADRSKGLRPGGRRDATLGAVQRRAVGRPGHGPAEVPQGTGDPGRALPAKSGRAAGVFQPLAHRIEGGADMFLMPSRFEPCGLNQLYSLRYGTVPLVRATGGLADTITGYDPQSPNPAANGFVFQEYSTLALSECLRQACDVFRRPEVWKQLMAAGMAQDWSWARSAKEYIELYRKMMERGGGAQTEG